MRVDKLKVDSATADPHPPPGVFRWPWRPGRVAHLELKAVEFSLEEHLHEKAPRKWQAEKPDRSAAVPREGTVAPRPHRDRRWSLDRDAGRKFLCQPFCPSRHEKLLIADRHPQALPLRRHSRTLAQLTVLSAGNGDTPRPLARAPLRKTRRPVMVTMPEPNE